MTGVAIVGAGTMGRAIAAGFARSGERPLLVSRDPASAGPAPAGVDLVGALPDKPPAMVVEAIPEDLALKTAFFRSVEVRYGPDSAPLMASNTSGLPLQDIADRLARPDLFLGIHWFHPADELPMVESVRVAQTSPTTVDTALALLRAAGWDSIVVPRPAPGAVVNRLQHAILHEAYHLMAEGLASVEDIDRAARWLLGPRMCIAGLLKQKISPASPAISWPSAASCRTSATMPNPMKRFRRCWSAARPARWPAAASTTGTGATRRRKSPRRPRGCAA